MSSFLTVIDAALELDIHVETVFQLQKTVPKGAGEKFPESAYKLHDGTPLWTEEQVQDQKRNLAPFGLKRFDAYVTTALSLGAENDKLIPFYGRDWLNSAREHLRILKSK